MMKRWRKKAEQLRYDTYALYLACKHPLVPWYAKLFTALIVSYALSPIDLIPDFIPVLGYLDDVIIIAAGFSLVIRIIPREVMKECREKAVTELNKGRPKNWIAASVIVIIWLIIVFVVTRIVLDIAS